MDPWTERAFGPWYLRLYAHRDDAEARDAVRTLSPWLPPGGRVLDAACGAGRHLRALDEAGRPGVGVDRSAALLGAARNAARGGLVRGDMRRLPFGGGAFAAVLSMFTSFGYFEDREAHRRLLEEFRRVTGPGGTLALDYLNAARVRASLEPRSLRRVGEYDVEERREIRKGRDADRVHKEITIRDAAGAVVERYGEEVALYDVDVVLDLLRSAGWNEAARFGDYRGTAWTPVSPRLFLVARAAP